MVKSLKITILENELEEPFKLSNEELESFRFFQKNIVISNKIRIKKINWKIAIFKVA